MTRHEILTGMVLEEAALTLDEFARACRVDAAWVVTRIETGVLSCTTVVPERRFSSRDLQRARRVRLLEQSFDADPELAAMVADLIDEVRRLEARMRRAGLSPD